MNPRLRVWSQRTFVDPAPVLRRLRELEIAAVGADLPDRVRRLRTNALKEAREARLACIFAYGMQAVLGTTVFVSPGETEDCDFLALAKVDDTEHYLCVQLKELAPEDLSPTHTLDALLGSVNRRPPSDAVLAIHLNRRTSIPTEVLAQARVPYAELWYFWAADPEHRSWYLFGGAAGSPGAFAFEYPS